MDKNSLVNTRPPPLKKHASGEVVGTACAVVHGGFMNDLEIHTDMWMYCNDIDNYGKSSLSQKIA